MGRVLDKLYRTGLNQIFVSIVLEAIKKYELNVETTHLDSTFFCVHGNYETGINSSEKSEEPQLIKITYGYSRDRRPDLKQFMMDLICTSDGDVPLWMRIGSGNESDQKQFVGAMMDFKKELKFDSIMVADSALYGKENLQKLRNVKWISRVPFKVKAAKNIAIDIEAEKFNESKIPGYRYIEIERVYGDIKHGW